jgi:hypothetical protein
MTKSQFVVVFVVAYMIESREEQGGYKQVQKIAYMI